jgi:hypothetical protein
MPTLSEIFDKRKINLYQNESLDLDHYYQEPYQDNNDLTDDLYDMGNTFETNGSRQKKHIDIEMDRRGVSNFAFFMDGSRRTYKIGDIVINGKTIMPVVVAQVRAGSTIREYNKKLSKYYLGQRNLLLLSHMINDVDYDEIKIRITKSQLAKDIKLEVVKYKFDPLRVNVPVDAAIGRANEIMHQMEIDILHKMVNTANALNPRKMLVVDGPLQFIAEDTGKPEFADLFYDVVGVSKSFDPMLPVAENKRGSSQIGTQLLKLEYGDRTPVFMKRNSRGRVFGCWYLRIRPRQFVHNPLEGIIKIEKMALSEDIENGLDTDVVDNLSLSLIEECSPTCHGRDERWANHLYPVYLTETMIKSSFMSDLVFVNNFKRDFR